MFYGGIDSDGITKRARNVTSVMAGVAKRHAVQTSCPIVLREFYFLADEDRKLFTGIGKHTTSSISFGASFEVEAASRAQRETLSLEGSLPGGSSTVRLSFTNDWWGGSSDTDRNLRLDRLAVRDTGSRVVDSRELETLPEDSECNGPDDGHHYALHCNGSVDVAVEVPKAGHYTIDIVAWADQAGDEFARLDVEVLDATQTGGGAEAVRDKLVELYDKLLGIEVTAHSPDVEAAFKLFVDITERRRNAGDDYFQHWNCHLNDIRYYGVILEDIVITKLNENGDVYYDYDWDRLDAYLEGVDFSDPHNSANAWVVVLAYLMMDYRYLYL